MKNILITGIICSIITGCVTVTNVNPSSSPTASPAPTSSPVPSNSPVGTPIPSATATPDVSANGTLEGKLTIGPLCPVEPCTISEEQKKQAYDARKIQILMPDEKTLVKEFIADYKTEMFKTELHAGRYFVNVTNAGIGAFEKKEIIIEVNKTTVLNIDIDTGIR